MATKQAIATSPCVSQIPLTHLRASPRCLRPCDDDLSKLKASIQKHGLIHPLLVRKTAGETYEIISGHRRFRAIEEMGMKALNCEIVDVDDREAFEMSLVENLQRQSLNPVEEALAFRQYVEIEGWGKRTTLSKRIGKSVEYITHRIKLLDLPNEILSKVGSEISASHAEELAWIKDTDYRLKLAKQTVEKQLTVDQLHELAAAGKRKTRKARHENERTGRYLQADPFGSTAGSQAGDSDQILRTSITALRYAMSYIDSYVERMGGNVDENFRRFLVDQRYGLHQILDHFISLQTHRNRTLRRLGFA